MFLLPTPLRRPGKTALAVFIGWLALLASDAALAVPSFARQTGAACSACHVQSFGPGLTPYGRSFKLNGYTWGNNDQGLPPVSGMIMGSFTNTKKDSPDLAQDPGLRNRGYNSNNNFAFDEASLFYAGRVWSKAGAFVQFTYDGVEDRLALDNTDIRVADRADLWGQDVVYGVSFNNSPTTQDLWNTTPAWGTPYAASPLAGSPAAGPIIASFGGQLGGATLYSMINDLLYVEAGAYGSFSKSALKSMGNFDPRSLQGGAPYWRLALQHDWGGHYFSIGQFGFRADVIPAPGQYSTDRYTDLGVDATYQYLADMQNVFELKGAYIRENQNLGSTFWAGGSNKAKQQLNTLALNAAYTYDQTYALSLGYNRIGGSQDHTLYGTPPGRPGSEYFTVEADYIPFGKHNSVAAPWLNLRFAVQYTAYTKFDGGDRNYNGTGGRASDNNTLFLNSWLIF